MTPPYSTNSSSSPFPFELNNEDHDHQNHTLNFTTPNYHVASSSSAHSRPSHLFLNSSWDHQPQYYDSDPQFYYPQQHKVDNHAANGNGGSYDHAHGEIIPVKWMSSKMRVMQKMKSSDRAAMEATMASATTTATATTTTTKIEDQKRASSSLESEHSSNSSSNHSSNNVPIRVCADCNTTKTPLWRSGPKGPKSLCNACGIRQRKARRAMVAAAAAAANCTAAATEASSLKIKVKPTKEKAAKNTTGVNHHHHHDVTPFKKRCKIVHPPEQAKKKQKMNGFEDFLIKLSNKNSAYQRVFPQDEKDAAILLMALSCGLVHS